MNLRSIVERPTMRGHDEWRLVAACRGMDADIFYPPENQRGHARSVLVARAREVCVQCPVLAECRTYAMSIGERHGVWGGLSETDRRKQRKGLGVTD